MPALRNNNQMNEQQGDDNNNNNSNSKNDGDDEVGWLLPTINCGRGNFSSSSLFVVFALIVFPLN